MCFSMSFNVPIVFYEWNFWNISLDSNKYRKSCKNTNECHFPKNLVFGSRNDSLVVGWVSPWSQHLWNQQCAKLYTHQLKDFCSSTKLTFAGLASPPSPPPLRTSMFLRSVLSWWMVAPCRCNDVVTSCISVNVIGGVGSASNAEPPPEIAPQQITCKQIHFML